MGFWSTLGDMAGGFIGDPGLGDQISGLFGDVGQTAGKAAQGAASGRIAQGQLTQGQDRNAVGLYNAQLQAAKDKLTGSNTLASQAVRGDTMQNAQDATISGLPAGVNVPTLTGGLRPSLMGPNSRNAGSALSHNALMQLLQGGPTMPTSPTLTPLQDQSGLEKGLGIAGLVGSIGGPVLKDLFGNQNQNQNGVINIPGGEFDPDQVYG